MITLENYLESARAHEFVFRNILRDLANKGNSRPLAYAIPNDFNLELNLEEFYKKYSAHNLPCQFTLLDFKIDEQGRAIISFDDIGNIEEFERLKIKDKGNGIQLRYKVNSDSSVTYETSLTDWEYKIGRPGNVAMFNLIS